MLSISSEIICKHWTVVVGFYMGSRPSYEIEAGGQPVQDGAQTLKIACHPDRSQSTRGTSLNQRDSKLSHEIEASGQSDQNGA